LSCLLWDDDDDGVRRDSCGFGRLLIEDGGDEVRGCVLLELINIYFFCVETGTHNESRAEN
jgi:hypothetical protein